MTGAALLILFVWTNANPSLIVALGLTPAGIWEEGRVWTLFTYLFVHNEFGHLLLNLVIFWLFGRELEWRWGSGFFTRYFVVTGVGAGVLSAIATPGSDVPIIGASGSIYGLLIAYVILDPDRRLTPFGIKPFGIKMKHVAVGLAVAEFLAQLREGPASNIAHVAHLGGMGVGWLYLKKAGLYRRLRNRYYRGKLSRLRARRDDAAESKPADPVAAGPAASSAGAPETR